MSRDVNNEACPVCGNIPYDSDRRVLVQGRMRRSFCSQACLRVGVRTALIARKKALLRGWSIFAAFVLAVAGTGWVVHRLRQRKPPPVVAAAPPPVEPDATIEPSPFGPSWPPTDEEWQAEFAQASWVYPLPGPARRWPKSSREIITVAGADKTQARCRTADRCGVDLGGDLWGEHVYAAHDGVVDRLQRSDDAPGGVYVRVAHWGGAVFTHYFHLAAVPTRLAVGSRVTAGEVIGLVGDTGLAEPHPHLRFALSVRPSSGLAEIFWDPAPLMSGWPLRVPSRGSVAALTAPEGAPEAIAGAPSPVRHASLTRASKSR